jgi:Uma2 family endonuclease
MATTTLGSHTVKDWLSTPEGEHWQLIHGRLILTEETYANSSLAREIEVEMALYLREHPSGVVDRQIAFSFPGMAPSDREGVVPDLCYLPKGELSKINPRANAQEGVIPALVAEMLSPSTRKIDLVDKVEIYREAGVAEYWIFNLDEENVRIYQFRENREEPVAIQSFEDTLTTPLLPGFSLNLPRVLRSIRLR